MPSLFFSRQNLKRRLCCFTVPTSSPSHLFSSAGPAQHQLTLINNNTSNHNNNCNANIELLPLTANGLEVAAGAAAAEPAGDVVQPSEETEMLSLPGSTCQGLNKEDDDEEDGSLCGSLTIIEED